MTFNQFNTMMERAKSEVNSEYRKKLNKIRLDVYELNKEVGFYDIAGMTYRDFLEAINYYSYDERLMLAYALLQHIKALDNMIFDEEGKA